MAKKKFKGVGTKNCELKKIPKPLVEIIIGKQKENSEKAKQKGKLNKRETSFVKAALDITVEFQKLKYGGNK